VNTEYLKNIKDVNLEVLPFNIRKQFEMLKFKFDIARGGAYLTKNVFRNIYCEILFVYSPKELDKRILFNENIQKSISEYEDGYFDAFYEPNLLIGITGVENQVFEVFSGVHMQFEKINNPSLLYMKQSPHAYNKLHFLQKNLYDYGREVGHFIHCWAIILNNPILFEAIFDKYYNPASINGLKSKPEFEKEYFKVGLLLAENKLYKKTIELKGIKMTIYVYNDLEFESVNKLAIHSGLTRQYINDTFNNIDSNHNIYNNVKFMKNIISYCEKESILPADDFLKKLSELEAKAV
jgi:hypothetical protein